MKFKAKNYLHTLKACLSLFIIKTAEGLQYRLSGFAGATTSIFWAFIEITAYTIFYRYSDNNSAGIIAGLNLRQVITYAWLAQVLFIMQPMSIDGDILNKITSGDVGIELCRPLDLYSHWFAKTAAARVTPLFCRGSFVLLFGLIMPSNYGIIAPASLSGFLCMLVSLIGAILLCTSFGMLMVSLRLNINWGEGPTLMIMLLGMVLSGSYLPLKLWPDFLQKFLLYQPFAGYLDIPLRFYLGALPSENVIQVMLLPFIWSLVFIITGRFLMSVRLKNIIVQGG